MNKAQEFQLEIESVFEDDERNPLGKDLKKLKAERNAIKKKLELAQKNKANSDTAKKSLPGLRDQLDDIIQRKKELADKMAASKERMAALKARLK